MDVLKSDVVRGMVGAASKLRHTDVSMSVYRQAMDRGDAETADRALGYASDSMEDASEYSRDAGEALKAAQAEAAEQEAAEARKAAGQQPPNKQAAEMPAVPGSTETADAEGNAAGNETAAAAQAGSGVEASAGSGKASDVKMYTADGRARMVAAEPRISVTV